MAHDGRLIVVVHVELVVFERSLLFFQELEHLVVQVQSVGADGDHFDIPVSIHPVDGDQLRELIPSNSFVSPSGT